MVLPGRGDKISLLAVRAGTITITAAIIAKPTI
jgi:hypothetical protein